MKLFVPKNFQPPKLLKVDDFRIRPLTVRDCDLDYQAMVSSVNIIKKVRGETSCHSTWPSTKFTRKENQQDLIKMEADFKAKRAFNYTIMNRQETEALGSIYLFPIDLYYPKETDKYDVDFSMWVTQKAYDQGLYPVLFNVVIGWIKTVWPWDFNRVKIRNAEVPQMIE